MFPDAIQDDNGPGCIVSRHHHPSADDAIREVRFALMGEDDGYIPDETSVRIVWAWPSDQGDGRTYWTWAGHRDHPTLGDAGAGVECWEVSTPW